MNGRREAQKNLVLVLQPTVGIRRFVLVEIPVFESCSHEQQTKPTVATVVTSSCDALRRASWYTGINSCFYREHVLLGVTTTRHPTKKLQQ